MITTYESYAKLDCHEKLSCLKEIKDVKLLQHIQSDTKRKAILAKVAARIKRLTQIEPKATEAPKAVPKAASKAKTAPKNGIKK